MRRNAIAAAALVLLTACTQTHRGPERSEPVRTAPTGWSRQAVEIGVVGDVTLRPPPEGATPQHSYLDAFSTCETTSPGCGVGTPVITLASFSDDTRGQVQPDGSVKLDFQNILAWVMKWTSQTCGDTIPGPGGPKHDCEYYVFVDANTGAYLESVAGGPPASPSPGE